MALSNKEKQRYKRHLMLLQVDEAGQEKIKNSKVLIVGAGGLGCPVAMELCCAGVGTIGIVDFDVVDISNLQRQLIYTEADIGKSNDTYNKINKSPIHAIEKNKNIYIPKIVKLIVC